MGLRHFIINRLEVAVVWLGDDEVAALADEADDVRLTRLFSKAALVFGMTWAVEVRFELLVSMDSIELLEEESERLDEVSDEFE
jgi:hypothetical protein